MWQHCRQLESTAFTAWDGTKKFLITLANFYKYPVAVKEEMIKVPGVGCHTEQFTPLSRIFCKCIISLE